MSWKNYARDPRCGRDRGQRARPIPSRSAALAAGAVERALRKIKKSPPVARNGEPALELGCRWATAHAQDGETVGLEAWFTGDAYVGDGTPVRFEVTAKTGEGDGDGDGDAKPTTLPRCQVKDRRATAEWTYTYEDDGKKPEEVEADRFPEFTFRVMSKGKLASSSVLRYESFVELTLLDEQGEPRSHARYEVTLPGGEVRAGVTDEHGVGRIAPVPPGPARLAVLPEPVSLPHGEDRPRLLRSPV